MYLVFLTGHITCKLTRFFAHKYTCTTMYKYSYSESDNSNLSYNHFHTQLDIIIRKCSKSLSGNGGGVCWICSFMSGVTKENTMTSVLWLVVLDWVCSSEWSWDIFLCSFDIASDCWWTLFRKCWHCSVVVRQVPNKSHWTTSLIPRLFSAYSKIVWARDYWKTFYIKSWRGLQTFEIIYPTRGCRQVASSAGSLLKKQDERAWEQG